ncbi:excinuclease ABC subunit B [Candidatus Giovannonibacteria bacterium RIFCSPHIGHO2_02_43_13]|uniref:UvrABC system protein B n=1 Tax=Candidatus Giovannonibacteria bacterium RIFCSPHIGHO2_02_43_13 TaxID=1798330 RepID=A0A1F5WTY0_9BACT|nr:MAG: excinuclease ABC subunit B [Candidatus Giovannonibacteria bacterium RIFCSPHIGHO2_12_FULL_44_42]OGF79109.1 MAG: excinuclease ABC subunit B [Candidatus Giovannonibacteria bacterium RIFCSPHIGHO2_02_43_13]OGF90126.1 MAG: excinuclease ABC subunit B [Candidatus Giovannonibacteria bacterium RIFCSPLOWO2_02_FULL_43_54]OGF97300.1 MAG: excinuclease ABC subunit B [Candidatus Giovannonibacteria bacterium RIFCSPLOWO2_12_FULL_44_32]
MSSFNLKSKYKPAGDQPKAIRELTEFLKSGNRHQTLLGVTGSGKTFTMANVIKNLGRPALVISHNKTLAAQLYQEFKNFFPENAVHYFVSYYDYYQPEAYIPQSDTYIEKDAKINDFIDAMRHAATATTLTRRDFVIIASVSCIYGIGDPEEYGKAALEIKNGMRIAQKDFLKKLAELRYERNDYDVRAGIFKVRGESVEVVSPAADSIIKIEWGGNVIERIKALPSSSTLGVGGLQTPSVFPADGASVKIFPAKHFVTPQEKLEIALKNIELELKEQLIRFKKENKPLEAERLSQRTNFDLKMLRETGFTNGIENYSRQLSFRKPGEPPSTLLDYLPKDYITFIDESHMTMPQLRGMYFGDRSRKETLVNYGFRLPSAIDNRPLKFEEFNKKIGQVVYVSATPVDYELAISGKDHIAEQIIRPTGLLDPRLEIRNTKDQIKNVISEIKKRVDKKERVIVTTLTKRMAEDLADYLKEEDIKAEYLHSDIKTIERHKILTDLRKGTYDVIVGINLLREGIDLPEVSLVIILDADKEGFLRNTQTLIQTIGRAARNTEGTVIMYADTITGSMRTAMEETERRRKIQKEHNKKHRITPTQIQREITENIFGTDDKKTKFDITKMSKSMSKEKLKQELKEEMLEAAKNLDFEKAAEIRDAIKNIK